MKNKKSHLDKCSVLSGTQKDECVHFPNPQHTPTPWKVEIDGQNFHVKSKKIIVASIPKSMSLAVSDLRSLDAAFIVGAVNCHEELVKELKKAADMCRYDNVEKTVELWDALIARAEGK